MATETFTSVIARIDTRDFEKIGMSWKPIAGTGEEHACAHCGTKHVVWVHVADFANAAGRAKVEGSDRIIGTSCAKKIGCERNDRLAESMTKNWASPFAARLKQSALSKYRSM